MNYEGLFAIQSGLDKTILKEKGIEEDIFIQERFLALLVEIGEMANETRCFKFWSKKQPSAKEVILEEYVDCLHFILSIGNHFNHGPALYDATFYFEETTDDLTEAITYLFESVVKYRKYNEVVLYVDVWDHFLTVGYLLGFSEKEIEQAYLAKNEVNHKRQAEGY